MTIGDFLDEVLYEARRRYGRRIQRELSTLDAISLFCVIADVHSRIEKQTMPSVMEVFEYEDEEG